MLVVVGEKKWKNKNQERTKYINLIGIHKSSFWNGLIDSLNKLFRANDPDFLQRVSQGGIF